jgi:ubiquinone/menaquinone biosynthesis C-methylase UbiE
MNDNLPELDQHDAIAAHDRIAKFYRYRTQYGDSFFRKFAGALGLNSETEVLDLCCGTGAVAAGLAPYCQTVVAVDGAPAMIDEAPEIDNVRYHVIDINVPAYADWVRGRSFDLITIGMGVHWLSEPVLDGLRRNLRPGGSIAVLATGFSGPMHNPWITDFQQVRDSLTKHMQRDWTGESQLGALGYARSGTVSQNYRGKISVPDLVNHLLSFSGEAEKVAKNYRMVLESMEKVLKPYLKNSRLDCVWTSSARLFTP